MSVKLLSFLTYNDKTVPDAMEVFQQSINAPTKYWGFKDIGISPKQANDLIRAMKQAEKTTFMEAMVETEKDCMEAANFALSNEFDYLIGMEYFRSVHDSLKDKPIKFFPTCGKRSGIPRMLHGSKEEIIAHAKKIEQNGVDGLCLSAYRFTEGDPEELARDFLNKINIPVIISGSINSFERLKMIKDLKPWGFTCGSAFFNKCFGEDLTFSEQIKKVVMYLND